MENEYYSAKKCIGKLSNNIDACNAWCSRASVSRLWQHSPAPATNKRRFSQLSVYQLL